MLNFVTAQSLNNISGGWSGASANIYYQLQDRFRTRYVGEIYPRHRWNEKILSKCFRTFGFRGNLPVFSRDRLNSVEKQWSSGRDPNAKFDFFHAATEWSACHPRVPYACYIDATFEMYMSIYSNRDKFCQRDIERISDLEKEWMRRASVIFFGTEWVKEIAIGAYDLDPEKCHAIWIGGNVPIPPEDIYEHNQRFLFISLNFEKKGGPTAVKALQIVRETYRDAELLVLGQQPPAEALAMPGVKYGGMLRKSVPSELEQFLYSLATARALVHPTTQDTIGQVIIECGYFGCPSIATRRFGIPELIQHEVSGLLIDQPITATKVAEHMCATLNDDFGYWKMREAVRRDSTTRLTWRAVGDKLAENLQPWLGEP